MVEMAMAPAAMAVMIAVVESAIAFETAAAVEFVGTGGRDGRGAGKADQRGEDRGLQKPGLREHVILLEGSIEEESLTSAA
jgi:hypothetical protein